MARPGIGEGKVDPEKGAQVSVLYPSVVGVDPGKSGYCCRLSSTGLPPVFWAAPLDDDDGEIDLYEVHRLASAWMASNGASLVVLEAQRAYAPQARGRAQGIASTFGLGRTFGRWEMALVSVGFVRADDAAQARELVAQGRRAWMLVEPQRWKARTGCLGAGGDRTEANRLTVEAARRLFPDVDLRAIEAAKQPERVRAASVDKSASLLIADFGRRILAD